MVRNLRRAAVIGAGTMGAAITAQFANAGVKVLLLDVLPAELSVDEVKQDLTMEDEVVRARLARRGLDAALKSRPASFFTADQAELVEIGNLEDDLSRLAEADWIVEAVVEDLDVKREVMALLDRVRGESAVVTTNTSGIPVSQIAEGTSAGFRSHFLGAHFFNPPRYVRLLELIPTAETLAEVTDWVGTFATARLGKGIVRCKDTPNFIANRLGSVAGAFALDFILRNGYTVEEVDAVTGPLIGRPKTATFRLLDLVGLDVASTVRRNLGRAIPEDEFAQSYLNSPAADRLMDEMVARGWHGGKAGQGFYKEVQENGKKVFLPIDLKTLEYRPAEAVRFELVRAAKGLDSLKDRLELMLRAEDRAGDLVRALIFSSLAYSSQCIPEIAESPLTIDNAVRWGFLHDSGPFEIWDMLGVAETSSLMDAAGFEAAGWVHELFSSGAPGFYKFERGEKARAYSYQSGTIDPVPASGRPMSLARLKGQNKVVAENQGATLVDLGDGVGCVEFHTKMNVLDEDVGRMIEAALASLESEFEGLVIGNEGENFSAGANLMLIALHAQASQWDDLDRIVKGLQDLNLAIRYSSKPVVAAPFRLTLGGGAEMMMHASRVVASAELYTGLVEAGMGLIPAGGGTKEMLRRIVNPAMRTRDSSDLAFLIRIFEQIGQAKVSTSAAEARQFGMLDPDDRTVMNPDWLLMGAKREVLHMIASGYTAPLPEKIYAGGRDALAALRLGVFTYERGGYITQYEAQIAGQLIRVMTGGELSRPAWVEEDYILELEREAFLSLCGEAKTQERIWHFLQNGKPLRN